MGRRGIAASDVATPPRPREGIRANLGQFSLLVVINAFVGAMVGLERTVLPLLAEEDGLGVASASAALTFLVGFGAAKATANLAAGFMADRFGRKPLLVAGWLAALPVAPLVIWAPSWSWIVVANVFLGVNQGFAWSTTVVMKIDLAGERQRGFAMGINEVAGYVAVAVAAWVSGALAATYGPRPAPFLVGIALSVTGLLLSAAVRETEIGHAGRRATNRRPIREIFPHVSWRDRSLGSVCQAGLVNNLNDAMVWGLLPPLLAAKGLSVARIGVIAAVYPAVWGLGQIVSGSWSDRAGRKPLIVAGLAVQAVSIGGLLVAGSFAGWLAASAGMGAGTALVYPVLLAAVGDRAAPSWRASAVGVYRLWRDSGYVVGALLSGAVTDAFGADAAVAVVAAITGAAAFGVAVRMEETLTKP